MQNRNRGVGRTWQQAVQPMLLAFFAVLGLAVSLHASAQAQAGDPPDRVARLSDASGKVWLYNPDGNEWVDIDRNRPLTTGDRIATDSDARAEITLGSTTLRLDGATELQIVQLDDSTYRVHLQGGSIAAVLRNPQSLAEFTLETDEGQFRVHAAGRFRFDRFDQTSDLTVYSGQAAFEGQNSGLPLTPGQHAQFWLDASGVPQYNMIAPARDAFASWNDERDRAETQPATATRYVSPEMTGAGDLDRYGQWQQSADYGPLWAPTAVAPGWTPYSTGHWAWVRPWGWTWVDDAPWGFAPFHYGRWVNYRNTWCWAPGTYVARPVYAPALVAWIGGPSVSVSIGVGRTTPVGWFPLAPHEVYVPSYRSSPRYVREVNITHVTNVTNITTIVNNVNGAADRREFANRKFPNAVTVVPAAVLTGRQAVGPAASQYRGNPEVRALVADGRPGPVMTAPPVATPPAPARAAEGRPPARPPFQARPPGDNRAPAEGRSRVGERPNTGSTPAPGATPATPSPVPPGAGARPIAPPPITRPPQGSGPGNPSMPRPSTATSDRPSSTSPSGHVGREPINENAGARVAPPPASVQRATPPADARPTAPVQHVTPPADARPTAPVQHVAPPAEVRPPAPVQRVVPPGQGHPPGSPPAEHAAPHGGDPRAGQGQPHPAPGRPVEPTRPVEAVRPAEVPHAAEAPHPAPEPHPPQKRPEPVSPDKPKELSK